MFKQSSRLSKALSTFTKLRDEMLSLSRDNQREINTAENHIKQLKSENDTINQMLSSDFIKNLPTDKTK